jgi:glucosylglycerate phosphorylase
VPHEDNISYFGNGYDEAHMVYNFALPPLVLHAFYSGDAGALSKWAEGITPPSELATFFNILDTHDGVGLMGVKNILPPEEIDFIIQNAQERGAHISYKMRGDMTQEPYEINTTWWSAVNGENSPEDLRLQIKRFLASRSISLVLRGVPGVYVHSVLGTVNDHDRVKKTGVNRDINRGIIHCDAVERDLRDPNSKLSLLLSFGSRLNLTRIGNRAFHPRGDQKVLHLSSAVFAVFRTTPEGDAHILAITNVTGAKVRLEIPLEELGVKENSWQDLIGEKHWDAQEGRIQLLLQPYDVAWLKPAREIEGKGWL